MRTQQTIHVLATSLEGTRAALATAIPLAKGSGARLVVFVTQVVPYAITLDRPVDSAEFTIRRYQEIVRQLDGDAQFRLCLCRRPDDVVSQLLPAPSTVVVGGALNGWLPSAESKLVHRMTRSGHRVIFVPTKRGDAGEQPSNGRGDVESDRVVSVDSGRADAE